MPYENVMVCGHCWEVRRPGLVPYRLVDSELEQCHYCGKPTTSGIYIRVEVTDESS